VLPRGHFTDHVYQIASIQLYREIRQCGVSPQKIYMDEQLHQRSCVVCTGFCTVLSQTHPKYHRHMAQTVHSSPIGRLSYDSGNKLVDEVPMAGS
jgi:hypothetical protein